MKYRPAGKRQAGRPLRRLLDSWIENRRGREAEVLESMMMIIIMITITI
jgi:hypothetical protein